MKFSILFAFLILLSGKPAVGWDVIDNPDRYISIELHASMEHLTGNHASVTNPGPNEIVHVESAGRVLTTSGLDMRIPLSKQVTVTFVYDRFLLDGNSMRAGNSYQSTDGLRGDRVGMGFRFYLAK